MKNRHDATEQIARAAMAAFEPFVRLFLDLGMSSPEVETLLRAVFVHETHRLLQTRDDVKRPVSHSKVALVSGVHRNTVSQILSGTEGPKIAYSRDDWSQRAGRVLRAWYGDAAYMEEKKGRPTPHVLEIRSPDPQKRTFWTLCSQYAPSIWPATILDELLRVKAVKKRKNGTVEALRDGYAGPNAKVAAIEEMGERGRDLLGTLLHNLLAPPENQRVVETMVNMDVDVDYAKVLRRIFTQRAQALAASVESELNSGLAKRKGSNGSKRIRMGLTIFAFEGEAQDEAKTNDEKRH
jgi:hypothetical protein